jgi:hypothetical protein
MYQVGYDPLNSAAFRSAGQPFEYATAAQGSLGSAAAPDCVRQGFGGCPPPPNSGSNSTSGITSGFNNLIGNLYSWVSNLMNSLSGSGWQGGTGNQPSATPEQSFQNATLTSWGDPHLGISGTTSDGQSVSSNWDSMSAHADLLSSDSFRGGFQVSNTVTSPNASGVTLNGSVTVSTNYGNTQVSLDKDGTATLTQNGAQTALQRGQQYALGDGEVVTDNADGSLSISEANRRGGSISATLKTNGGGGVDFSATASKADLGGYLVNKTDDAGLLGSAGFPAQNPLEYQDPYTVPTMYQPQSSLQQPQGYRPWNGQTFASGSGFGDDGDTFAL